MEDQPVEGPLPAHRTVHTQYKRTQISVPQAGFERTIPVSERAKRGYALDLATTVTGYESTYSYVLLFEAESRSSYAVGVFLRNFA
jgi:hypothetical protein